MRAAGTYEAKVMVIEEAVRAVARWRLQGRTDVFTNGCFDILHAGHLDLLERASLMGDRLVLGLNADASVRRLKGEKRPVNDERFRARILAAMSIVDAVVVFGEDTPQAVIEALKPDVLVKGGDYRAEDVVGAGVVAAHGGRVEIVPLTDGHSTTGLIGRIRSL